MHGHERALDERILEALAGADDLFLFAGSRLHLEEKLTIIKTHTLRYVRRPSLVCGELPMDGDTAAWKGLGGRRLGPHTASRLDGASRDLLFHEGPRDPRAGRHGGHGEYFRQVVQAGWKSFFAKRPLWLAKGRVQNKRQAPHLAVFPALSWCAGTRHWTLQELKQIRSVQVRMTRRLAGWWPYADEAWAAYTKRTARHAESLWKDARIPWWDKAIVWMGWRWAGRSARLEAQPDDRRCVAVNHWRGAWWGETVNAVLRTEADPMCRRLNRGHRQLGRRSWGDAMQGEVDAVRSVETSWHEVAQDRAEWAGLQAGFVARVLRLAQEEPLPWTRWMMQQAQELDN